MSDLDELDRRIIAALQLDGRRTFSNLAKDLGIPASSVRYRLKRLEDEGMFQVVGVSNPIAIGFDQLAMIGINVRPGTAHATCEQLSALPESSYVVMTSGSYDIMCEVICRDTEHLVEVLETQIGAIESVTKTESFFVLEVHKLAYGWGVPGLEQDTASA